MRLNTNGKRGDDVENGGGLQAAGWFRAAVVDAGPSAKQPDREMQFVFEVSEGQYRKARVTQWVTLPEHAADADAAEKLTDRLLMFAKRLGLWDGVAQNPDIDWDAAIGKDVVIHTEFNEYLDKEKVKKSNYRLNYSGVYPFDHPKIPAKVREELRLGPAALPEKSATPAPRRAATPVARRADLSSI